MALFIVSVIAVTAAFAAGILAARRSEMISRTAARWALGLLLGGPVVAMLLALVSLVVPQDGSTVSAGFVGLAVAVVCVVGGGIASALTVLIGMIRQGARRRRSMMPTDRRG